MEYFTSKLQEMALDVIYENDIKTKQKEIDTIRLKTGKIQKFTARAYINEPERVFLIQNGKTYLGEIKDENVCPTSLESGGKKYTLDIDYEQYIKAFIEKHTSYKVVFSPSGKYGPTVDYCSITGAIPAVIYSHDGETLVVEDENKYSPYIM